jgi:large subunit ribosomal protein L4e
MFAPTKVFRRWHRKVNLQQKRFAVTSALAASALPALVFARGHKIDNIPEVPLVVSNDAVKSLEKTKAAVALLKSLNAYDDVEKTVDTRKIRAGKGKRRNRRYVQHRGPLVVYDENGPLTRAFRNIPGVELAQVSRLNLLQLAPGGHLGRFIIWTQGAFAKLDSIYGTWNKESEQKVGYTLPRGKMYNTDLQRIINSDEIQSVLRAKKPAQVPTGVRGNPLRNLSFLVKLNPYALTARRTEILKSAPGKRKEISPEQAAKKKQALAKKQKIATKQRASFYKQLNAPVK